MKATVSLDGIWGFLQSLSLSNSNKRWLAERLIESRQMDTLEMKREKEISYVRDSMTRALDELHEAQLAGTTMPDIDNLIAELK